MQAPWSSRIGDAVAAAVAAGGVVMRAPPFNLAIRIKGLVAPAVLVDLESPAGRQLLRACAVRATCDLLRRSFIVQESPTFCGVASMVVVLNALGIAPDATDGSASEPSFTQGNVLGARTERVRSRELITQRGMSLDDLDGLLATFPLDVTTVHATDSTAAAFRAAAIAHLEASHRAVLVNFSRRALGQRGRGHISPLAAYDPASDRFLLLDVAGPGRPPAWVTTSDLFFAMSTIPDRRERRTRGYVLLERRAAWPAAPAEALRPLQPLEVRNSAAG